MPLRLQRRARPSFAMRLGAPLLAVLVAAVIACGLLAASGKAPLDGFYALFLAPLTQASGWADVLTKSAPLALIGAGLVVAFRSRVWNIGAQGQYIAGAVLGSALVVHMPESSAGWLLPSMIVLGVIGGLLYAAIPAFLSTRFNANVILTSLMFDYVALAGLHYLTFGPWRDPSSYGFPGSVSFQDAASLPVIWAHTQFGLGAVFAFLAAPLIWILLRSTLFGFQVRVSASDEASTYAGFSRPRVVWMALLLSGALAGLAGLMQVAGPINQLRPDIYSEVGFSAIIVAYLGQLNPLGVLPAALLVGLFSVGANNAQITLGLSSSLGQLLQGVLLFTLLASNVLVNYRLAKVSS
ncbi:ABC transporter permease [Mangrovitalea sediminis]|uniref:ABC transporter permease n=1 Tax=Mangrovitalea sediminis TaxID=1982043 RepID=UPI000BE4B543|nr:ABC transporter permease [Mangrovitalea sediminis]